MTFIYLLKTLKNKSSSLPSRPLRPLREAQAAPTRFVKQTSFTNKFDRDLPTATKETGFFT